MSLNLICIPDLDESRAQRHSRVDNDKRAAAGEDDAGTDHVNDPNTVRLTHGEVGYQGQTEGPQRAEDEGRDVQTPGVDVISASDDRYEPQQYHHYTCSSSSSRIGVMMSEYWQFW